GRWRHLPEPPDTPFAVDRAQLVQHDVATLLLEPAGHPKRVRMAASRQRRHDERSQMLVQLIRRNDDAGPRLLNRTAARRVELHEVDLATTGPASYHVHSSSSNRVAVEASSN